MTLLFEKLKSMAEHETPPEMRPVLAQIFAEFTVLGFIAMCSYFLVQSKLLEQISESIFAEPERLQELFERIHFDLFFTMLSFGLLAMWLMVVTAVEHGSWMAYERFAHLHSCAIPTAISGGSGPSVVHRQRAVLCSAEVLYRQNELASVSRSTSTCFHSLSRLSYGSFRVIASASQSRIPSAISVQTPTHTPAPTHPTRWDLPRRFIFYMRLREAREQLHYTLLRDRFVRIPLSPHIDDAPGDDFALHSYLFRVVCGQVREDVELQLSGWIGLILVVVPGFELVACYPAATDALLVVVGVLLVLVERSMHVFLSSQLHDLSMPNPLLRTNELHRPGADPVEMEGGHVWYVPTPPFLAADHFVSKMPRRKRFNRQLSLYCVGSRLGVPWLTRFGDKLHLTSHGPHMLLQLNTFVLLFTSTYIVVLLENITRGTHSLPWLLCVTVPVVWVVFFGMPGILHLFAYVDSIEVTVEIEETTWWCHLGCE